MSAGVLGSPLEHYITLVWKSLILCLNLSGPALFFIMIANESDLRSESHISVVETLIAVSVLDHIVIIVNGDLMDIGSQRFNDPLVFAKKAFLQYAFFLMSILRARHSLSSIWLFLCFRCRRIMLDFFQIKKTHNERIMSVLILFSCCLFQFKIADLLEVMNLHWRDVILILETCWDIRYLDTLENWTIKTLSAIWTLRFANAIIESVLNFSRIRSILSWENITVVDQGLIFIGLPRNLWARYTSCLIFRRNWVWRTHLTFWSKTLGHIALITLFAFCSLTIWSGSLWTWIALVRSCLTAYMPL